MGSGELRPDVVGIAVTCGTCGRRKKPVGRSASPLVCLCDHECAGYYEEPRAGSLWPGESEAEFGYPVGNDGTVRRN